jgi:hypothetical protein
MKYENFQKAKGIVERIDKTEKLLKELNSQSVSIKLLDNQWTIMTIGSWSSCEHECRNYAARFLNDLKCHYEGVLRYLHSELETL